jgi:hypothetical protein
MPPAGLRPKIPSYNFQVSDETLPSRDHGDRALARAAAWDTEGGDQASTGLESPEGRQLEADAEALAGFLAAIEQEARELEPRQRVYLYAFARRGYKMAAAAYAGVSASTLTRWRKESDRFRELEATAQEVWVERMEQEFDRRGLVGVLKPVFGKLAGGRDAGTGVVGHVREYSDTLAVMRLKALAPDRYAERRKTELTGAGGGPVQMQPVTERLADALNRLREANEQAAK